MAFRIFACILLLLSVLFMPFYISVILGLAGMAYFPFFIESVILLLLTDLLFGVAEPRFFGIFFVSLIISALLFIVTEALKKKLIFYP